MLIEKKVFSIFLADFCDLLTTNYRYLGANYVENVFNLHAKDDRCFFFWSIACFCDRLYVFPARERAFWYFKYSSKKVANIARLPKISNVRILFTIHNRAKSTTAIDLNKRRDYHNNCQTTLVRPRFVHVSHIFTQFIFEIFLCITQAGLLCVFS